jgi:cytidylate kinase
MQPQRQTTGPLQTEPPNLGQLETRVSSPRPATEPNVFARLDRPPIVSIDGGAGSGKSSVAKLVADAIGGAPILDSGRWFRALGFIALRNNIDPQNAAQIEALGIRFSFSGAPKDSPHEIIAKELLTHDSISSGISTEDLETQAVADAASKIGKHRGLREIFQSRQLEEALKGCITVGRAQGSEVFTQEFSQLTGQPVLRILLHADLETRATRRFHQQNDRSPTKEELATITGDLRTRDTRDMTRDIAPLMSPEQARERGYIVIDTSTISSADVAEQIVSHIRKLVPNLSTDRSI